MNAPTSSARGWQPGDIIGGRFRITGTVGRGAMGAVYGGEHIETGQRVAIKFMLVSDEAGEEFVRRFSQEARVMAGLKSPNTIRIYDFGRAEDGALYMAMELLTGTPLDKHIMELQRKGESMDERAVLEVGVQILRSLGEAHNQGLVHRDMKPGNVFLTDDGSGEVLVKVLDFGIARVADSSLTNAGKVLGTPTYMSPEQWEGEGIDARSDLYSVGCILYCCATGQPPYQAGENMLSLMKKHCCDPIPDPRATAKLPLSDGFVQIVGAAMAKQAADRFADARAMRESLQALAGGAWAGTPDSMPLPGARRTSAAVPAVAAEEVEATMVLGQKPATGKTLRMDSSSRQVAAAPDLEAVPDAAPVRGKSSIASVIAAVIAALALIGAAAWWKQRPAEGAQAGETVKTAAVPAPAAVAVPAPPQAPVPVPVPVAVPAPALIPAAVAREPNPIEKAGEPTTPAPQAAPEPVARGLVPRKAAAEASPPKSKAPPQPAVAPAPKPAKKGGDQGVQIHPID